MTTNVTLRRAELADLEDVLCVQLGCHGAPQWSEAVWRTLLDDRPAGAVERTTLVALAEATIVGFVVVSCAVACAELESVAVQPVMRRRGIGHMLCRAAMDWARSRGAEEIQLEVRASSMGALALYAALGFLQHGRRSGYYREPADDALLLRAAL